MLDEHVSKSLWTLVPPLFWGLFFNLFMFLSLLWISYVLSDNYSKLCCLCSSFADPQLGKKYKTLSDIDSVAIADKFQSISGTKIYGIVAWREWCTLERTLTQETLAWLGKVQARINVELRMLCQVMILVWFVCSA